MMSIVLSLRAWASPITWIQPTETMTMPALLPPHPWKTLDKVNATTFHPGDKILLRSSSLWKGQLWPKGSGVEGSADHREHVRRWREASHQRRWIGRGCRAVKKPG